MAIKNTENDPNPEWLLGGNPKAIEEQEAQGQKELVESCQLPKKINDSKYFMADKFYEDLGIEVIGTTEGDEIFYDVKLPEGWKKEPTDHPMWSHLVDDQGKVRAQIFYKAAFYDRDAFVNVKR